MIDLHTHSQFSFDSTAPLENMVARAAELGMAYYGTTEHVDYCGPQYNWPTMTIDEEAYFARARKLQEQYRGKLNYLVGLEFGYDVQLSTLIRNARAIETFRPDFVINSVHFVDGHEFDTVMQAFPEREDVFPRYLKTVKASLAVPYHYDIVAHIGYVSRYAEFERPEIWYEDYKELYDEILTEIIARDKILELNASVLTREKPTMQQATTVCLPRADVITRYYELGGRKISYASDAHTPNDIGRSYKEICALAKQIGFEGFTVPTKDGHILVDF